MARFTDKRILVTGGTSGIGLATARKVLNEGARVAVTGTRDESLDQARTELPGALVLRSDAGEPEDCAGLAKALEESWGGVDGAFLNAGIGEFCPLEDATPEAFDRQFHVNVLGPMLQAKALKARFSKGGAIVLNLTAARKTGMQGASIYASSKAALRTLTRTMAAEFAPQGVRVNAVSPGAIGTGFFERSGMTEEDMAAFATPVLARITLGRWGTPEEVANVVAFLLSSEASYVTGSEYMVDGGYSEV